jgi:isopenicillin N synthase-like dioxygenase
VHRAINRSGVARYSIPLFFGTDYNVPLEASLEIPLWVINILLMVSDPGAA